MKWKVLSSLSNTGESTGLFLLADYGVSNSRFGDSNDWTNSIARKWCQSFYENSNIFTESERNIILKTNKLELDDYPLPESRTGSYLASSLNNDYIFIPSVNEMLDPQYGFSNSIHTDDSRCVEYKNRKRWWWLRSRYSEDSKQQCLIYRDGNITNDLSTRSIILIRPAFNLTSDNQKILLSSLTDEKDTWKLTLMDKQNLSTPKITNSKVNDNQLSFHYSEGIANESTSLSVLITDLNYEKIYCYSNLDSTRNSMGGSVTFDLPENFNKKTCSVYIFTEQINDIHSTNYASEPIKLSIS